MDALLLDNLSDYILDSLDSGVLVVDLTSHLVFLNREGERILGQSRDSLQGGPIIEQPGLQPFVALVNEHRKEGPSLTHSLRQVPAELVREDGTRVPLSTQISNLVDAAETVRGYVIVFRDVSRLQELEERARHSEKLAALGTVAAGVAHEVRNPLHTIQAAMDLLEIYHGRGQNISEYVGMVHQEVGTLGRLVDDILSFSRELRLERRPLDLLQLVQNTLAGLSLPDGIETEAQGSEGLPSVVADRDRIQQVLRNLVRNAVEAQPEGGRVVVRVEGAGRRCLPSAPEGACLDFLAIRVEDTGPGIPPENLPRLFEPFFTRRRRGQGTGLGLGICQKIVEAHQGFLEVETTLGEGSRFTVLLPVQIGSTPP